MFDDVLNKSALSQLKIAPVFMMFFGYWIMGNQQMFRNFVEGREYKTDPIITNHKGYQLQLDLSLPLFIFGCLMLLFIFATGLLLTILKKLRIMSSDQEDEVDEQLGTYV
jgi:hypothetical protein